MAGKRCYKIFTACEISFVRAAVSVVITTTLPATVVRRRGDQKPSLEC